MLWAPSAEEAFAEFNRVTLYLGAFLLVLLLGRRASLGRWCDALALAIVAITALALVSRLFPGALPDRGLAAFLPSAATRLSFPLGYWNGLAVFVAFAVPLLLRLAIVAQSLLVRGVAVASIPALAATIYLTSSRGGVATALTGTAVFLALTARRWTAVAALVVGTVGALGAVSILLPRTQLVNGPLEGELASRQGWTAAILIALVCIVTGAGWAVASAALAGRDQRPRWLGIAAVATLAVALVAGIALADPVERFHDFKQVPVSAAGPGEEDFVRAHLLSGNGSGRWQFWTVAVEAWKEHPLEGVGAGSYEHWWAEHASFAYFVRDAHSLYLETLGELGLVGLTLVVGLLATGLVSGARRTQAARDEERVSTAALTAVLGSFALALGLDWIWELTAVSLVGIVVLALLTGLATQPPSHPREVRTGESESRLTKSGYGLGVLVVVLAWALISMQAIALLSQRAHRTKRGRRTAPGISWAPRKRRWSHARFSPGQRRRTCSSRSSRNVPATSFRPSRPSTLRSRARRRIGDSG